MSAMCRGSWKRLLCSLLGIGLAVGVGSGLKAEPARDADGKDSGFEYVMSFGTKGSGQGQFGYVEDFDLTQDKKHILVTDAVNATVQVFDKKDGKFIAFFGGKGDADHQLHKPEGISVAPDGRIFVADYSTGYVKVFAKDFTWIKTFSEYGDGKGQNAKSEFTCIFQGRYYMPEAGNHRVSVWDLDGTFIMSFGKKGTADGEMNVPEAIKVNSRGEFFLADLKNDRIQVFDKDGKFLRKWGTTGSADGQLKAPAGIGIDRYDNVYVGEIGNDRVQVFTRDGTFITKFGKTGTNPGEFGNIHGCMVDKDTGWVYVADTANNRVQVFKPSEQMITRLSGK